MSNHHRLSLVVVLLLAFLGSDARPALGWGAVTECVTCHTGFDFGFPLHDLHAESTNDCQDCHFESTTDELRTNESRNHPDHSCNGCHLVEGLAAAHGESICGPCHTALIGTSEGEDVLPYYYTGGRSSVVNPCRLDPDNGGEDWDLDGFGLDNDGDGLYDADDPDCAGIVDTEESTWSVMKALFGDE